MNNNNELYMCRVCGKQQEDPPWGNDGRYGSFEICDCCGVEFGHEDFTVESTHAYRKQWLKEGAKWFMPKEKPEGWSLENQLQQIPQKFKS